MTKRKKSVNEDLFFKMLPAQVLIFAMASVNSIVDGVIAGQFIDARTVGVIGLFITILNVVNAIGQVLLGGSSVLIGRYMGQGDIEKTNGVFSLNLTMAVILSGVITLICFFLPGMVADICGSGPDLKDALMTYVRGISLGLIPQVLSLQLGAFLQVERQSVRNYIGVATMIVSNVILNITFVKVLDMGIFGLALSTSVCNWLYFAVLISYYFTDRAQLKYNFGNILWSDLKNVIKIGFPGALLVFCLSFRELILNRLVQSAGGADALSAKSALGMVGGLFIAFCIGTGSVSRILMSVNNGEEDKDAIKDMMKVCFTKALLITIIMTALIASVAKVFVGFFFPDPSTHVYALASQAFYAYIVSIPLILVVQIFSNYLQAMGHNLCVNVFSFVDGFVSVVVPALLLTPVIGVMGVWLATPIGIIICTFVYPAYAIIYWKRIPKNLDEWMLFRKDFGVDEKDRLIINIENNEDVSQTSEKVQTFCKEHGYDTRKSYYAALCLEEMAGNVVTHGFNDSKKHFLDVRTVCKDDGILLRIKDDCKPFDPKERLEQLNPEDVTRNVGIRMAMKISDETTYQNMMGLNILSMKISK
ncbi:MAG: ATP-binding protein [Lachnospiraceae bacterium]|nr:ATP-binding protein [Lachnospiraceae bacterium]